MDQKRPVFSDVERWLHERKPILDPMFVQQRKDEDWFDAGSSDAAKAKIAGDILGLPKSGWTLRHIPLAYLGVMVGVNQVHVGESIDVTWHIPDDGKYDAKTRKAREQVVSRWARGAVYVMDTYSPDSIIRELVIKLIGLGEGALTYSINYDRWTDPPFGWVGKGKQRRPKPAHADRPKEVEKFERWERDRARAFPFDIMPVHPTVLYFDPHSPIPYDYIREEWITIDQAEALAPGSSAAVAKGGDQSNPNGRVRRITYVSPQWMGQWVGELAITQGKDVVDGVKPNPSGLPLHRMAFGGFGSNHRDGTYTSKGMGLIRPARDLLIQYIAAMNQLARIQGLTAFPNYQVGGGTEDDNRLTAEAITFEIGAVIERVGTAQIEGMPELKVPQSLVEQLQVIRELLELLFGPNLQRGQAQPGETLGGQRNRYSIAASIYRSAQQAGQQIVAAVLNDLLYLIKYELRERCPVQLSGDGTIVSIGPDDIDDGGGFTVDFSPPTEDEKAFKAEGIRNNLKDGLITPQDAAEQLGFDNPIEQVRSVRVQKLVDIALGSDAIGQLLVQHAMEQMGVQPPAAMGATPNVAATPSGQVAATQSPPPAGNPEQQQATQQLMSATAAPR